MQIIDPATPFAVFEQVRATDLAFHYERVVEASRVDLSHLLLRAADIRDQGSSYLAVSRWSTREEADTEAARRNAVNDLPGVHYFSELEA